MRIRNIFVRNLAETQALSSLILSEWFAVEVLPTPQIRIHPSSLSPLWNGCKGILQKGRPSWGNSAPLARSRRFSMTSHASGAWPGRKSSAMPARSRRGRPPWGRGTSRPLTSPSSRRFCRSCEAQPRPRRPHQLPSVSRSPPSLPARPEAAIADDGRDNADRYGVERLSMDVRW
jgi:hypothetical protein